MRRLVACYFDPPTERGLPKGGDTWRRLARVLERSARKHCPGWSIEVLEIEGPAHSQLTYHFVANTRKLDHWADVVQAAPLGDEILLIDADTMILRPLDDVWAEDFDIGITIKAGDLPLNAGVVFVRVCQEVKDFFSRWRDENRLMLEDTARHSPWYTRYGGINQAALGRLLEGHTALRPTIGHTALRPTIAHFMCREWNCEDTTWDSFSDRTRIVHVKSELRRLILDPRSQGQRLEPLAALWRQIDAEAA